MTGQASWTRLADGKRLHFHHGPIDIITEAFGHPLEYERAYQQGFDCFQGLLTELVSELDMLRTNVLDISDLPKGDVARNMVQNVRVFGAEFITPMAAVAGAVADKVLAAMVRDRDLTKVYVNNGGDIAIYLNAGEGFSTAIVDNQDRPMIESSLEIGFEDPVRGIATSGWRGRSQSLGIADAVTVLADNAARADSAATLIANAVKVQHEAIVTKPANQQRDDTDLADRLITVDVGDLPENAVTEALDNGRTVAENYLQAGLIQAACLSLKEQRRIVGTINTQQNLRRMG